ncbi:transcriptional regulator [Arthrobacter sp. MYb224]|uniref:GAF domain-containing protein n=1 Tax=Micrococcaceae TaxID=1268 RepID=UPI000CFDF86B|nr:MULTISPECIES: GAF domain-containing protein [unclassified Arthrobacter]PQZ98300.1 transcriptional regulator [Arthrobacter sp. MYb224]PQZ98532.1 transcriptional regulator [Arthrobacter sp. MYb229]PRB47226.1 transcriptional regulator [Arthrobacter sp. MYb216]
MTVEHRGSQALFQAALAAGEDPTNKARGLKALHQSWAEGTRIPSLVRPVVARSWSRAGAQYKDIVPLDLATVRERRESNEELNGLVELFKDRLLSLATQAGNQLVISDSQGYVLWVLGPSMIRRRSDDIGFVAGARWREGDVGTNGIGAAMAERTPVQIFGPEHAREEQHSWVCTSAPVSNPATSSLVGTITLAGSFRTAHPHSLALVSSVAHEAELLLRGEHDLKMQRLELAATLPEGAYLLVDSQGSVASARGYSISGRISLPPALEEGRNWIIGIGAVDARRTAGGWLLQRADEQVTLELCAGGLQEALVHTPSGTTRIGLSAKHWQILELLASCPAGATAAQLQELWPAQTPNVTIRAEISRLRGRLRGLIASRPYRLMVPVYRQP